jgi:ABC-type transporter Mla subunit MlaD
MKKNLSDIIVAVAVIVCSLVLVGALTYALSGRHPSKTDRIIEIDYPDVTGIKLHSEVRYAGAPAGAVTNIRLLTAAEREAATTALGKRNAVRVTLTLLSDLPPLPADVRASLASETLLSEKFVALSAGSPGAPTLANGTILQGNSGGGLDGVFEAIGPLADSLPPLLKTAEELLRSMDPLLRKTTEAVDTVKVTVSEIGPRANKLLDGLKITSDSADVAIRNVNKLVDGPNSPLNQDLEELKNALVKMQQALSSANMLIGRTDRNLDGRMQELSVVLQNLKVATTHAKVLTQTLGENPHRLIFGGKPKKLTGEQEILRSSKPVPGAKP